MSAECSAVGPEPIIPAKPNREPVIAKPARRIYEEPFLRPERPPYAHFETTRCDCWPAGGPPCREHGALRLNPHHEHGHYYGNDNWDASCCICDDNPCSAVTVERMRCHRWYDLDRERARATAPVEEPPF